MCFDLSSRFTAFIRNLYESSKYAEKNKVANFHSFLLIIWKWYRCSNTMKPFLSPKCTLMSKYSGSAEHHLPFWISEQSIESSLIRIRLNIWQIMVRMRVWQKSRRIYAKTQLTNPLSSQHVRQNITLLVSIFPPLSICETRYIVNS